MTHTLVERGGRIALLTLLTLGSACGPKVVASRPPTPTVEPPAPVVVPVLASRFTIPSMVTDSRYEMQSVAELERDSAGRKELQKLTSSAQVDVRVRRNPAGGFQATGRITGYRVVPSLTPTPLAIDSLRFDAVLDNLMLRVSAQPPLANECDRPETGALTLVRDLLVRVPAQVVVGEQWRDSTVHVVCRAGVLMTVRTANVYVVTEAIRRNAAELVVVRRTSTTRLTGTSNVTWRPLDVGGAGSGTLEAEVSVLTGAVQRLAGSSTMTLTVTDRGAPAAARTQQVTQRVNLTGVLLTR